jgi:anti-sigma-K factor RskA
MSTFEGRAELRELLAAYALDAVDPDERAAVEEMLAEDPAAVAELAEYRATAAYLAISGTAAPAGLWDRIAVSLEEGPPAPGPELARVLTPPRRRWSRVLAVAAAAAVVVIAGLAVALARAGGGGPSLQHAYATAAADPASVHVPIRSPDGVVRATAVIDPAGNGYLSAGDLPRLPTDRTYQLWGVMTDGRTISLGVLGPTPEVAPFGAHGDLKALALTDEVAGGVVQTAQTPALVGAVT